MIPYYSPLYATVQDQPRMGVLRVIGWGLTGQPYVIPIKAKEWNRRQTSSRCWEWDPATGVLIFHDSRADAETTYESMLADVRKVIVDAEQLIRQEAAS